jgi:hypothetical protein
MTARIKTNSAMLRLLERFQQGAGQEALAPNLLKLAHGALDDVQGAVVLRDLVSPTTGNPKQEDLTGFEALVNHIHLSDYLDGTYREARLLRQGIAYADAVAARLVQAGRPFRVLLGRDPASDQVTVRFFLRRKAQPWNDEDLENYQGEEVMQWDVGPDDPEKETSLRPGASSRGMKSR